MQKAAICRESLGWTEQRELLLLGRPLALASPKAGDSLLCNNSHHLSPTAASTQLLMCHGRLAAAQLHQGSRFLGSTWDITRGACGEGEEAVLLLQGQRLQEDKQRLGFHEAFTSLTRESRRKARPGFQLIPIPAWMDRGGS